MPDLDPLPMEIRPYRPVDQAAVLALHVAALQTVGAHAGSGPWDDDLRAVERTYPEAGGAFLVGELEGRVVAMGALRRTSEHEAELKRMRVEPALQGRGIGRRMLDALEVRARELGVREISLDTTTVQVAARRLYEGSGYREERRERWREWEMVYYRKRLPDIEPEG